MVAAGKILLRILTPSREVLSREVDSATLPAAEGEVGILPGHAALLAAIRPGEASFRDGAEVGWFAVSDGFLEVNQDVVTVLVRAAEPAHEIDVARAERRRLEREAELRQAENERQMRAAEVSIEKQAIRIQVARRSSGG